ncbi:hypothetical protein [Burkholderia contaminans]|uniref:hypothetical protein n=1 Tax=Burkholderia contaminans TaxID=488447 RepID=UPI0015838F9E|nr:hypothetical protein [Burkholderia contaminans]
MLITYSDFKDSCLGDSMVRDILITPVDLLPTLSELSHSILSATLIEPEFSQTPTWKFSPVNELWLCDKDEPSAIIVVTPIDRHLFNHQPQITSDQKFKKIFPEDKP